MVIKDRPATPAMTKVTTSIETITPALALEYLENMPKNRRRSQPLIDRYTSDMQNGEWRTGLGDPLRFSVEDALIDGQHRLWAVASAGVTLDFTVIRGLPTEAMLFLDGGRARSLADALYLNGEADTFALAGAINFYAGYLKHQMIQKTRPGDTLTKAQGLRALEQHPGLRDEVKVASSIRRQLKGGGGRWAAATYVLRGTNDEDTEAFVNHLITGENLHAAHPVLQLRQRLLEDAISQRKLQVRDYTALIFKSWNMYRSGQTSPRKLTWRGGGLHPENYPIPE
jgi:hypothetical protein